MELSTFYDRCHQLAGHIRTNQQQFLDILADYQTHEVNQHEITASIDALLGVSVEYDGFEHPSTLVTVSCYLPVNMPLYSLILYTILPSFYFETVYVRPGMALSSYVPALVTALQLESFGFNHVAVKDLPAKLFTELFAKDSDVVLFTGKYENALMLERECPDSMLIFEGTGPCPFFVFENGDARLAAERAVAMRCFNSGQDCVAPDVLFVHDSQLNSFTTQLKELLKTVKVGDSRDPDVRIAPAIKEKYLLSVQEWLEKNRDDIVYGGTVDTKDLIVYPTVLSKPASQHRGDFKELFSPIFYILSYEKPDDVVAILNTPRVKDRSMYACIFGHDDTIQQNLALCTVLENMNVNDQENGNKSYGGFGPIANFVSYNGERQARPLLISRDIRDWVLLQERSNLAEQALQVA